VGQPSRAITLSQGGKRGGLPQQDDTWEAEFRSLPTSLMQNETQCVGLVSRSEMESCLRRSR
jgi:hypothetical protein